VIAAVRERQSRDFVPRSKSSEGPASADLATEAWEAGERPGAGDVDRARDLIGWGRRYLRGRGRLRACERELFELLERGGRLARSEPAIVAAPCAVRARWEERSYLGEVGERVEAELGVRSVRSAGRNRFGEVVWHGMCDDRLRWSPGLRQVADRSRRAGDTGCAGWCGATGSGGGVR
jgi:hypothetical protein